MRCFVRLSVPKTDGKVAGHAVDVGKGWMQTGAVGVPPQTLWLTAVNGHGDEPMVIW